MDLLSIETLGPLVTISLVVYAACNTSILSKANQFLPRVVDGVIASVSIVLSITLMQRLDDYLPFKLLDGKMLSSAVVFCTNPTPPSPHAAIACSAIAKNNVAPKWQLGLEKVL